MMQLPRPLPGAGGVFYGVNPLPPIPLAQALDNWPNLFFALEFACATVLIVKVCTATENL